jgi:hypothetical protein
MESCRLTWITVPAETTLETALAAGAAGVTGVTLLSSLETESTLGCVRSAAAGKVSGEGEVFGRVAGRLRWCDRGIGRFRGCAVATVSALAAFVSIRGG